MIARAALALIVAGLALPAAASAGNWATVGMPSPPDEVAPGDTWSAEFEQLQHGVTPYEGGTPRVLLVRPGGEPVAGFPARPAGKPGVYRARVVFPDTGSVRYLVEDDFGGRHSFGVVRVSEGEGEGEASASAGGGLSVALAAAAACVALAALVLVRRRRAA